MKHCPRCGKTYSDANLNFCLDDGELLAMMAPAGFGDSYRDDSPPTVMLDEARRTNPTNWPPQSPPSAPPAQWQAAAPNQFAQYPITASPSMTLAIVSLCLGISALTVGWCCYIGVLLGPAAIVTGFIAMSQNKKDPQKYGGRGMAIGGLVTGAAYIALMILFVIVYGAAIFLGSLGG